MPSGPGKTGRRKVIGASSYASTIPFDSIRENVDYLKANGLGVEVMMYDTDWVRNVPRADVETMGNLLDAEGIVVSVHGPLFDLNPGSQDTVIRDYTKFNFMRALNISAALRAVIVVFHLGLNPLIRDDYREAWLKTSMGIWKPVVNHAKRLGITIAMENMFLSTPYFLRQVVEEVDSPNLMVCLDVGHVNVYSTVPIEEWMDVLGAYVVKIHINDNDARNDLHLPFGAGNVDIRRIYRLLQERRIKAMMTLEMTPDKLPTTLEYIRKHNLTLP